MSVSTDSFSFNDVNYGDELHGLKIVSPVIPFLPEPRVHIAPLSNADGAVTQGRFFKEAYLSFDCVIVGESEADRAGKLAAVVSDLYDAATVGECDLILGCYSETYTARLISGIDGRIAITGAMFNLRFVIPQPL